VLSPGWSSSDAAGATAVLDNSHDWRSALRFRADEIARSRARARCEECRHPWTHAAERWRAYWIDDGPNDKLLFYCAGCAEREFGTIRE
jgi:hypothetical protein